MTAPDDLVIGFALALVLLVRGLGYAEEPWWLRWGPVILLGGTETVSALNAPSWIAALGALAAVGSLVAHLLWRRNWADRPWSIRDAASRGALIRSVPARREGPGAEQPPMP